MKKASFYCMKMTGGKAGAVLENGYTDGVYNYYKTKYGTWYAIHPENGLSICTDTTRAAVAVKAHDPEMLEAVKRAIAAQGKYQRKRFVEAVNAAQKEARIIA